MKLVAEISLYPLADDFIPPISDFIKRLNSYLALQVVTTPTSTRVVAEYGEGMSILAQEMARTHAETGQAVFVCKFLKGDDMDLDTYA